MIIDCSEQSNKMGAELYENLVSGKGYTIRRRHKAAQAVSQYCGYVFGFVELIL